MKKGLAATVLTLALGVSAAPAVAGQAAASTPQTAPSPSTLQAAESVNRDTPRCVSRKEWRRAKKGMKMRRVHRIFDIKGTKYAQTATVVQRKYRKCGSSWEKVYVDYRKGKPKRLKKKYRTTW